MKILIGFLAALMSGVYIIPFRITDSDATHIPEVNGSKIEQVRELHDQTAVMLQQMQERSERSVQESRFLLLQVQAASLEIQNQAIKPLTPKELKQVNQ